MLAPANPWTARFEPLPTVEQIRSRAALEGAPAGELSSLPVSEACRLLQVALNSVYYPTTSICQLLLRLFALAAAHSSAVYTSREAFKKAVYDEFPPFIRAAICLTGLAGVGKSQLLKALLRLMPSDSEVVVDSGHSAFPLVAMKYLTVNIRTHLSDILMQFFPKGTDSSTIGKLSSVKAVLPRRVFECGVSLVAIDEMQFVTLSQKASARVVDILLTLCQLGVPFVFAANFSLIHRLKKRPHEERQRLLAAPLVLNPEPSGSADWAGLLQALLSVAPTAFALAAKDAVAIHRYTAGLPRLLVRLLVSAYRCAREDGRTVAQLSDIERAYRSVEYSQDRADVEALRSAEFSDKRKGTDLSCPFQQAAASASTMNLDDTKPERGGGPEGEGCGTVEDKASTATTSRMPAKKPISVEELLAGLNAFRIKSGLR